MKVSRLLFSIATASLLGATAYLELIQLRGMMFGIGESNTAVSLLIGSYLLITALGILGLGIAGLGSLTGKRAFALVGFIGAVLVIPMVVHFGWVNVHANIVNSRSMPISLRQWIFDAVPFPLVLVTIFLCWLRIRRSAAHTA